jgi:hypothetical protein
MEADWVAEHIDRSVNLGARPAFVASDGLRLAPFCALQHYTGGPAR